MIIINCHLKEKLLVIFEKVTGNTILTINQWYHVVFYSANGTLKIYINGTLDVNFIYRNLQ